MDLGVPSFLGVRHLFRPREGGSNRENDRGSPRDGFRDPLSLNEFPHGSRDGFIKFLSPIRCDHIMKMTATRAQRRKKETQRAKERTAKRWKMHIGPFKTEDGLLKQMKIGGKTR